ncbi:MAG: aspartate--tRNA(Asn) ligase [archaeon]|nr:MAG: aspartate--tRNA(Asn) ligase [archaeon]
MKRTYIQDIKRGEVFLQGFVHELRDLAKIKFLLLRDVTGVVQCFIKDSKLFKKFSDLSLESVVEIKGKAKEAKVKHEEARSNVEVEIKGITLLNKAAKLPILVNEKDKSIKTDLSKRLDWRFLDLRKPKHLLIFRVSTEFERATREFFIKEGLIELHSPKLMGIPSEGAAELFEVPYFNKKAYLAQSPQIYKQMAMAAGFEKVFEIAPVFRANPSHTTRHDTEYTSLDVEISWIDWKELMDFKERWIKYSLEQVKKKYGQQIEKVFGIKITIPKTPFPRIKYQDALKAIKTKRLDTSAEKKLGEYVKKKYKHDFVFVTHYPISERPFYHMRESPKLTMSFDLIYNGVEITTGSQREHRAEILQKQAKEMKLNLKPLQFYVDFFKYGCPKHAGFGLSPTRVITQMLGLGNVREATFSPRDTERLLP